MARGWLRQSTAFTYRAGPFVDSTDGVTPETGLSIGQADIQISKAGGAFAQTSDASPTTTHDTDGYYQLPLTATDTGTLGPMRVEVTMSGALLVWDDWTVVPAAVYDSLVAGNDTLPVDVTQWLGTTVATPTTAGVPEVDVTQWAGCTTFEQGGFPAIVLANSADHGGAAASIELDEFDINTQTQLGNLTTSLFSVIAGNAATLANVNVATVAGNAITAAAIAADAITEIQAGLSTFDAANDTVASVTTVGSVTGAVGSVTGNVGGIAGTITTLDALDAAQDTQHGTTRTQLDSMSGATFDTATDSLEAIRNRGDAAWTTGAGGTPPDLMQSTTIATLASQTSFTLTAGSADDDAYNGALAVITDQSTATQKAKATVSDYVGSTRTVTLSSDPAIFTMAAGDSISIIAVGEAVASVDEAAIADAVLDEALSGHTTAGTLGKAIADIEADATAILADTNELQTNQGDWATATGFSTFDAGNDTVDVGRISGNSTAADSLETFATGGSLATLPKVDIQQVNGGATAADDLRTVIEAGISTFDAANDTVTPGNGTITAAVIATGAIDADAIAADAITEIQSGLSTLDAAGVRTAVGLASANLDTQIAALPTAAENATAILAAGDADGLSVEEAIKVLLAASAGKLSGAATTTITIRAVDDSKARITATVDADGNRSAVTVDATG